VSRYLLDSNIISEATKPFPSHSLTTWLDEQSDESLFIASITVAEIWRGILEKPPGKKRRALENWFHGPLGPQAKFAGRVFLFDNNAALVWGRFMAEGTASGQPRSAFDMLLAAIAEANDCTVVTGNEKHFAGLKFINPLRLQR
jgi:toxin FitB